MASLFCVELRVINKSPLFLWQRGKFNSLWRFLITSVLLLVEMLGDLNFASLKVVLEKKGGGPSLSFPLKGKCYLYLSTTKWLSRIKAPVPPP